MSDIVIHNSLFCLQDLETLNSVYFTLLLLGLSLEAGNQLV